MKDKNTKYWVIIIILIIIILLLLSFIKFGIIDNKSVLIPTGKVDVFDIDINCDSNNSNCTTTDKNGNIKEISVFDEMTSKDVIGEVFINDDFGNYVYQQNLNIFTNSAFEFKNMIAPGTANTYHFVVHNSTNSKLKYYIEMYEDTEYSINLKYRLKKGEDYIIGDEDTWVTADSLKSEFSKINVYSSDNYSLDWQWLYEDNKDIEDTLVGENMTSVYKLNIRFYFEQIGE